MSHRLDKLLAARKSMTFSPLNALLSASITTTTISHQTTKPPIIQTVRTGNKSARRNTSHTHPINQTIQSQPRIAPPVPPPANQQILRKKNRDPRSEMKSLLSLSFPTPALIHPSDIQNHSRKTRAARTFARPRPGRESLSPFVDGRFSFPITCFLFFFFFFLVSSFLTCLPTAPPLPPPPPPP
ncbi:hypothetical protein IWX91DRAFT_206588 [Phyllosticta citricarpa]